MRSAGSSCDCPLIRRRRRARCEAWRALRWAGPGGTCRRHRRSLHSHRKLRPLPNTTIAIERAVNRSAPPRRVGHVPTCGGPLFAALNPTTHPLATLYVQLHRLDCHPLLPSGLSASACYCLLHFQVHASSLGSVFAYNLTSNGWWPVPIDRVWTEVDAFDWRRESLEEAASATAYHRLINYRVPWNRYGGSLDVVYRQGVFITNSFINSDEYERPPPARCQHGRLVDGSCIAGFGVQRDQYGDILPPEQRQVLELPVYYHGWNPPLNFSERVNELRTYDRR